MAHCFTNNLWLNADDIFHRNFHSLEFLRHEYAVYIYMFFLLYQISRSANCKCDVTQIDIRCSLFIYIRYDIFAFHFIFIWKTIYFQTKQFIIIFFILNILALCFVSSNISLNQNKYLCKQQKSKR